jgi:hypothetical protein
VAAGLGAERVLTQAALKDAITMGKSTKAKVTMNKATKRKTAPGNGGLANAQLLLKRCLEDAIEDRGDAIEDREAEKKVLRDLISQIPKASPYLIQKFAPEAGWPESRFAEEFMASAFGYLDADRGLVPFYGGVTRLDAFLSHHLAKEELRRRRRDASSHEYETY